MAVEVKKLESAISTIDANISLKRQQLNEMSSNVEKLESKMENYIAEIQNNAELKAQNPVIASASEGYEKVQIQKIESTQKEIHSLEEEIINLTREVEVFAQERMKFAKLVEKLKKGEAEEAEKELQKILDNYSIDSYNDFMKNDSE